MCGKHGTRVSHLLRLFFIRLIASLPLLTPPLASAATSEYNQADGVSATSFNKKLNGPMLRGKDSQHTKVSICQLLLSKRWLLGHGTAPAIGSLAKMNNSFHMAPTGDRLRWKLQRTQKSLRFTKIEQASPGGSEFPVLRDV